MPTVSVIIPTRNRASLLRAAIESVLAIRAPDLTLEVLVIDDGSTDETAAVVAEYPVRLLRVDGSTHGASAARNVGLQAATGDFIAFLDDDDVWLPNNISAQLRVLARRPEYGAVFAQAQLTDSALVPFGAPVPAPPLRSGWIFEDIFSYYPQLATVVVRAAVARQNGLFDLSLLGDQDWDWLLRLASWSQIGVIDVPVMLFRQRGPGDEALTWRRLHFMLVVFRRHLRAVPLSHRAHLTRELWAHRGWYAAQFLTSARYHLEHGDRERARRCIRYAMRASLPHTALLLSRWRIALRPGASRSRHRT